MSLFRQLWLAVIASTVLALAGSFVVSLYTARHYLEHQLAVKNSDNAASLALSMSQLPKDPVTVELQVNALFDSGQYALIRIVAPEGETLFEQKSEAGADDVPDWFVQLFPIRSVMGQAQVSNGWTQYGTIQLVSHNRFAYQELRDGAVRLFFWFLGGALLMGMLGTQVLKRIKRPMDAVVAQSHAITERRFILIDEPRTPELNALARAMNAMVTRLKAMFEEEAARLEKVRREVNLDNLTGLANRAYFMNQVAAALSDDEAPPQGLLFILRLADLAGINQQSGRETADAVLRRLGEAFAHLADTHPGAVAARLNGADFALLWPGGDTPAAVAEPLLSALNGLVSAEMVSGERVGHLASGTYHQGENIGALLASIDAALASAESQGAVGWFHAGNTERHAASHADWRKLLEGAIAMQRLRLIEFPVTGPDGRMLHMECPLRLQADENGEWLAAGSFMPMASRLAMTTELDLAAVRLALARIEAGLQGVAVNLSGESLQGESFRERLHTLLAAHPGAATKLWLEVSEIGAFQHFEAFSAFCNTVRPLGCQLGIEHFGRRFSEIGRLHDIGLHYLKVDGSFVRGIDSHRGNQAFLKGLCAIAHTIGLQVIAESVQSAEELATLPTLGFDGATGPALNLR